MKNVQLCHVRLSLKIYKKIKILSVKKKETISTVIDNILHESLNVEKKPKKRLKNKKNE
jgi:hypothetical protein